MSSLGKREDTNLKDGKIHQRTGSEMQHSLTEIDYHKAEYGSITDERIKEMESNLKEEINSRYKEMADIAGTIGKLTSCVSELESKLATSTDEKNKYLEELNNTRMTLDETLMRLNATSFTNETLLQQNKALEAALNEVTENNTTLEQKVQELEIVFDEKVEVESRLKSVVGEKEKIERLILPSFIPSKGHLECVIDLPPGADNKTAVDDLAWHNSGKTLLVARSNPKQLWSIMFDPERKSVTNKQLLCEGEEYRAVSSGKNGLWGAVIWKQHIILHHPDDGEGETWAPPEVPEPHYIIISDDGIFVAGIGSDKPVFLYDRNKVLKKTININGNKEFIMAMALKHNFLVTTTWQMGHLLHAYNLTSDTLITVGGRGKEDGKFIEPVGVAFDGHGQIYVADWGNRRVSLFSSSGEFLNHLDLDLGDMEFVWALDILNIPGKPSLLAVGGPGRIKIFSLE